MYQETVKDHVCDETFCAHSLHASPPAFSNDTKTFDLQLQFWGNLQMGMSLTIMKTCIFVVNS